MIFRYAAWPMLALSLIGVAGLVLGIAIDVRWLLGALLVLFVVAPLLIMFLYFAIATRNGNSVNTTNHYFTVKNSGLECVILLPPLKDNVSDSTSSDANVSEENHDTELEKRSVMFEYNRLAPFRIGSDAVIIPLKKPEKGFLWIPADAFPEPADMTEMLQLLDQKCVEQNKVS
ncbi:MAG: hypothetical protein K2M87_07815 [Muribaculaceae bacterium]|nr:hypothetical protein [Muribaculaceae bacterium]